MAGRGGEDREKLEDFSISAPPKKQGGTEENAPEIDGPARGSISSPRALWQSEDPSSPLLDSTTKV
jgi:hypothetical protein